jgi:hypothetical protein
LHLVEDLPALLVLVLSSVIMIRRFRPELRALRILERGRPCSSCLSLSMPAGWRRARRRIVWLGFGLALLPVILLVGGNRVQ